MSLKFENSRRDDESRPVCMDLNAHLIPNISFPEYNVSPPEYKPTRI
jgi:hypothetical protein